MLDQEKATFVWENAIKLYDNPLVIDCDSGDANIGINFWIEQGFNPKRIIAVDAIQHELDSLKVNEQVKTLKVDYEGSSLIKNMPVRKFDVVVCVQALTYLSPDASARLVENMAQLLAQGGRLVVSLPGKLRQEEDGTWAIKGYDKKAGARIATVVNDLSEESSFAYNFESWTRGILTCKVYQKL